ncbi:MAG: PKD domain-containing protein [Bacteroidota bacterium]
MKKHRAAILLVLLLGPIINGIAQDFTIQLLPFNSKVYDEFAPVYYKNGVAFCSNRKNQVFVSYTTEKKGEFLFDLYYVEQVDRTTWGSPTPMGGKINSPFHEGPATFNNRETEVYFTRNQKDKKKVRSGNENRLGIFRARISGEGWDNITPFPHNSDRYNVAHPSLSSDGEALYFVSDMPGGEGGTDIYVSYRRAGGWSAPENLGPAINTNRDEKFPFIHNSGRLYFSSEGHGSIGRLDIFYSEQAEGEWHKPIPMDPPMNTRYDDFGIVVDDFQKSGLFCSDRNRSDDIYSFVMLFPIFDDMKKMEENNYCYEFFEQGTSMTDTVSMEYEWDFGDGTKKRGLIVDHCFDTTGNYLVQLNVVDQLTGEVWFNEATYEVPVENIEQLYINAPDTVKVGQEVAMDAYLSNVDFEIEQYYWDLGDGRRTKGEEVMHIYSRPGSYIIQLGAVGVQNEEDETAPPKEGVYKNIIVLSKNGKNR